MSTRNKFNVLIVFALTISILACSTLLSTPKPVPPTPNAPTLPASGKWTGTAEFGTLEFIVNPQGTGVTYVEYTFSNYRCGNTTRSGTIGNGQETGWDGEPIVNGEFTFDGSTMTLHGTFVASGTSASGTWNYPECSSSGTWAATPKVISQDLTPTVVLPNIPINPITETGKKPFDLMGVWKSDDIHALDNSWNIPYSVYFQFTNTKQYVYHGVDAFNSNQPTDVSDIVYLNINDSTFIKKLIDIPNHPELLGKFQKWTWRFSDGNVLFTIYSTVDSQDLALNDGTVTALATGVQVQQSQPETLVPTDTPALVPTLTSWNGIPIMPQAITGQEEMGDYQFTTKASVAEITTYYEQEMVKLGWSLSSDMMTKVPGTALAFAKGNTFAFFKIDSHGENNVVYIHLVEI